MKFRPDLLIIHITKTNKKLTLLRFFKNVGHLFLGREISVDIFRNSNKNEILNVFSSRDKRLLDFFKGIPDDIDSMVVTGLNKSKLHNFSFVLTLDTIRQLWFHSKNILEVSFFEILVEYSIQKRRFDVFENFLANYSFKLAIFDFDRYPVNIPLIHALKIRNVKVVTIIHGTIIPVNHFVPFIADEIWVWGELHKKILTNVGVKKAIKIVGNPKILELTTPRLIQIRNTMKIGIGFSKFDKFNNNHISLWRLANDLTKHGYIVYAALHPLDINDKKKHDSSNLIFPGKGISSSDFLKDSDLMIFGDTQLSSDLLNYDIPIVIFGNSLNEKLRNGFLLCKEAGIPFFNDINELNNFISFSLDRGNEKIEIIERQKKIHQQIFSYTGNESIKMLIDEIKTHCH